MPRKIRELIRDLERTGFRKSGGRGSHRKYSHPRVARPVTISGGDGDDAHSYQEEQVRDAVRESRQ